MKRTSPLLAALALFLVAAAPATQPVSRLTVRAHNVLATMKETNYQHVTDIDETAGQYNCDCSGLVSWLLRKELPKHYAAVPFPKKFRHPRAVEFCQLFESAPVEPRADALWQQIARVSDTRAGDVMAWRKDPQPEKGNTGHIVLVDGEPKKVAGDVYELVIIDSTTRGHKDDTRKQGETGVGRGAIFLKVDSDGKPIAVAARAATGPFVAQPMSIGRPIVK